MQNTSICKHATFCYASNISLASGTPDFSNPETRKLLRGMAGKLTQDASMSDARAYISFLDAQTSVDTNRKIGTCGYCMADD